MDKAAEVLPMLKPVFVMLEDVIVSEEVGLRWLHTYCTLLLLLVGLT